MEMEIIKAIILGIVEGITEWLPISSTGHMILVDEFIKMDVSPEFMEMFLVVIQLGAIMAVVVIYWKRLIPTNRATWIMWLKIIVACLPAAIIGTSALRSRNISAGCGMSLNAGASPSLPC